jgi:prevent-host-death family protein
MPVVNIQYAKANLAHLIKRVSEGEQIVITRRNKPVARLIPFGDSKRKRLPGSLKGKLRVGSKFFAPLPAEELTAWE